MIFCFFFVLFCSVSFFSARKRKTFAVFLLFSCSFSFFGEKEKKEKFGVVFCFLF